jgi:hypothetical protein
MKIRVVSKGSKQSGGVCPWLVDYPPEAAKG